MRLYSLPSVYGKRSRNKITTLKFEIMKKVKKFIKWYFRNLYNFYKPMYDAGVNPFMI